VPDCKAVDDAEAEPLGHDGAFVNYIAEKIEPEFSRRRGGHIRVSIHSQTAQDDSAKKKRNCAAVLD